jgi:predicted metal-dependent phosphoesterase TrpH
VTAAGATPQGAGRFIDLHLHSTASDGTEGPETVVARAHTAGLAAVALTDHDTVDGVAAAAAAGERLGVRVIAGVELSAYEGMDEAHVLGLHIVSLDELRGRLSAFRDARRERAEAMVRRLNEIGVRITFDDVLSIAGSAAIGRPHVARALVENGYARDLRDAFDRYLGAGRPAYLEKRRMGMREAIDLVHECGGIAILAHPGPGGTRDRISALAALGLDGVEVLHPSHSSEDRSRLLALGKHLDLVPSGGSDSHGPADPARVVGAQRVPSEWLARQDERVARRRTQARVA